MKIVLQRVKEASVIIGEELIGDIKIGYVLLIGFERGDDTRLLSPMIEKIRKIKLFPDKHGKFSYTLEDINGSLLLISQFTLFADLKKGTKPSLSKALEPGMAGQLYQEFVSCFIETGIPIESGVFGEYMQVKLQNDGPVTIILDKK